MRTALLTFCAILAFAGNSILGRYALGYAAMDPLAFTLIRLVSGGLMLFVLVAPGNRQPEPGEGWPGSWLAGLALFVYALTFSLAYVKLGTAEGALVLFAAVQLGSLCASYGAGQKPSALEFVGMLVALVGVAILLLPEAGRPDLTGTLLMTVSGGAWAVYSLLGQGERRPLVSTAANFIRASVLAIVCLAPFVISLPLPSAVGWVSAVASGALTSALGYALWYRVLRHLTLTQSGVVQLGVPVLAAIGGVILVGELLSVSLILSIVTVLCGIGLTLRRPKR